MNAVDQQLEVQLRKKIRDLKPGASRKNVTLITRAVLTKCAFECRNNRGILSSITTDDLDAAQRKGNKWIINVPQFKNGRRLVAESFILSNETWRNLQRYRYGIRPLVAKNDSVYLFLKSNGNRVKNVADQINRFKRSIRNTTKKNKKASPNGNIISSTDKQESSSEKEEGEEFSRNEIIEKLMHPTVARLNSCMRKKTTASRSSDLRRPTQMAPEKNVEELVLTQQWPGLRIADSPGKGRGLFTTKPFLKGEIICDYPGENVSVSDGKQRLQALPPDLDAFYVVEFKHNGSNYCIDGTKECESFGAKINHSTIRNNAKPFTKAIYGVVHLFAKARRHLAVGEEVLWEYALQGRQGPEWRKT